MENQEEINHIWHHVKVKYLVHEIGNSQAYPAQIALPQSCVFLPVNIFLLCNLNGNEKFLPNHLLFQRVVDWIKVPFIEIWYDAQSNEVHDCLMHVVWLSHQGDAHQLQEEFDESFHHADHHWDQNLVVVFGVHHNVHHSVEPLFHFRLHTDM